MNKLQLHRVIKNRREALRSMREPQGISITDHRLDAAIQQLDWVLGLLEGGQNPIQPSTEEGG